MFRMKDKTLHGIEKDKLARNFATYAILLSALGAMTFFGVCDPTGRKWGRGGGGMGQAAHVGGETIGRDEFNRTYQRAYSQYQRMYQDAFDPAQLHLAQTVLTQLVNERSLYAKAVELGVRASDDEILALLTKEEAFKGEDGKFSTDVMTRFLDGNGYTEASFLEEIRRSVTVQKLRALVIGTAYVSSKSAELDYRVAETKRDVEYVKLDPQSFTVAVSKDAVDKFLADEKGKTRVKEYYEANAREFNRPEQVRARHVLVAYKGARNATSEAQARDKDAAKQRAGEVLLKAKAPGADFAAIATASTDEPAGKSRGGDLGFFGREAMDKAFGDAAFALAPGQLSAVVETPFGYHVIKVEEKKPALATKLEDAQRAIAETILAKEQRPVLAKAQAEKMLAALKASQPIEPLLTEAKAKWESTGDVAGDARYVPGIGAGKEVAEAILRLATVGQVSSAPLEAHGNYYVLRLKSLKSPDLTKFDGAKKRELSAMAGYGFGTALYQALERQVRDEHDKKGDVWLNPDFLALDSPKSKSES